VPGMTSIAGPRRKVCIVDNDIADRSEALRKDGRRKNRQWSVTFEFERVLRVEDRNGLAVPVSIVSRLLERLPKGEEETNIFLQVLSISMLQSDAAFTSQQSEYLR